LTFQNAVGGSNVGMFDQDSPASATVTTFTSCKFLATLDIYNITAAGLFRQFNATADRSKLYLTRCLIDDVGVRSDGAGVSMFYVYGGGVVNASNTYLTNCTISLRTTALDYIYRSDTSANSVATLKNVIIANATGETITWVNAASGTITPTATYCDFYNITDNPTGTGVITSDPLFVDPSNGIFNLRPTSPCIDTGTLV
jgi:hypothetical protein